MKRIVLIQALLCLASAVLFSACSHKTDAKGELDKAAQVFGKAEPIAAPAAEPSAESTAPASAEPTGTPQAVALPAGNPAQQMQLAISSYKAGELEDAVTRLQKLRTAPTLTAEQRMALQDSVAAVMTEVYTLAAKGDPRAIQAVRQYEEMQTTVRH